MRKKIFKSVTPLMVIILTVLLLTGCRITINEDYYKPLEPEPDLVYNLKSDGTYSVSAGAEFHTVNLKIPAKHGGKRVTEIAADGFVGQETIVSVVIPEGVTTVGKHAFDNCSRIETVVLPSGLKSIRDYAFSGCVKLLSLDVPDSVVSLGYGMLKGCRSLAVLTIPFVGAERNNTEKAYLGYLFESENYLRQVSDISNKLEKIILTEGELVPSYAFYNCQTLTEIELPPTVRVIGDYAFYNCRSLALVTVPEGGEIIGVNSFENCISLEKVMLPTTLTEIQTNAFSDCLNLKTIVYSDTEEAWDSVVKGTGYIDGGVVITLRCYDKTLNIRGQQ